MLFVIVVLQKLRYQYTEIEAITPTLNNYKDDKHKDYA